MTRLAVQLNLFGFSTPVSHLIYFDLPLKFHPAAIRASAVFDKPNGVV